MYSQHHENSKLFNALLLIFPKSDAFLLATLLQKNFYQETIRYEEIEVAKSQMKDLILLAFEERILIPLSSRSGPAWEDKILDFNQEGLFYIPPVVKSILNTMCETGQPCCQTALRKTLAEMAWEDDSGFINMLQTIMKHAKNYNFEAGLLELFFKMAPLECDSHDFLDIAVACGMISPCPQKSMLTGLSWYEINPALYWDKAFLAPFL